jgi:sarcosine oxidase subunit beta
VIDFESGFYLHREGPGILVGGRERQVEDLAETAVRRLPCLADMRLQASWWGEYEVSPDHNAVVGAAEHLSSFFYATGFSGHGFQQAPAIGEHIAELVCGRPTTLDLSSLSLKRFDAGRERTEKFFI